ncbi:PEP-CTERM sorting domain-containing protein [Haloferula chungangensis]|uniref:PEP-CTERM sorting domain-containing protein n=1 Tax=Haloferula chungangensis TaxID=1048331 RepID=A0ABW2LD36_9BACT
MTRHYAKLTTAVPEPSAMVLFGLGLLPLVHRRR